MNLTKYNPKFTTVFDPADRFGGLMNALFANNIASYDADFSSSVTSEWLPKVDIKEERNRYVLQMDIPGVDPKDIQISMEHGILTIKGERQSESKKDGVNYSRIERSSGVFFRRFSLPDVVDADGITAKGRHGVLEVVIPKTEKSQNKSIRVEG